MSDHRIVKSVAPDGSSATVAVSGALTIEAAAELRQAFVDAMAEAPRLVLDARQLEEMDMSILQTVCSACKTAAARKQSFSFTGELPVCMTTLNSGIGAYRESACNHNNNEPCIWLGGVC